MFIFGHGGLTLLAAAGFKAFQGDNGFWERPKEIALVFFFSLLPDLIDKPITIWLLPHTTSTRWVAHTLVFWVALWLFLHLIRSPWVYYSWAALFHLFLDRMWTYPKTLLFPLLGWEMDAGGWMKITFWEFLHKNIHYYFNNMEHVLLELIGLGVLMYAGFRMVVLVRERTWRRLFIT